MTPTISVFTVVSQAPKIREDTVIEGVKSALEFADEIICFHLRPKDGTLEELKAINDPRIKIIDGGTWDLDKYILGRKKNAALQNCTMDWCQLMDADEVFHEKEVHLIKKFLKNFNSDIPAVQLSYYHFYRDPWHYVGSSGWYQKKPSLIRNHIGNFIGGYGNCPDTALDKYSRPLTHSSTRILKGVYLYHYGHCTSVKAQILHYNLVEKAHDPNWKNVNKFKWTMKPEQLTKFKGTHPKFMQERIKKWKK